LAQGASEATWEKRIEKEENRRAEKAEKMKALGYEFEAPKIKSAKNVSKKAIEQPSEQAATIENVEEEIQVIEAVPLVEEQSKPKEKKEKKKKTPKTTPGYVTEPVTDVSEKTLKRTKSKADLASAGEEIAEETTKKQKKSRKAKSEG